jgi:hypothetical protein
MRIPKRCQRIEAAVEEIPLRSAAVNWNKVIGYTTGSNP